MPIDVELSVPQIDVALESEPEIDIELAGSSIQIALPTEHETLLGLSAL